MRQNQREEIKANTEGGKKEGVAPWGNEAAAVVGCRPAPPSIPFKPPLPPFSSLIPSLPLPAPSNSVYRREVGGQSGALGEEVRRGGLTLLPLVTAVKRSRWDPKHGEEVNKEVVGLFLSSLGQWKVCFRTQIANIEESDAGFRVWGSCDSKHASWYGILTRNRDYKIILWQVSQITEKVKTHFPKSKSRAQILGSSIIDLINIEVVSKVFDWVLWRWSVGVSCIDFKMESSSCNIVESGNLMA